MAQLNITLDQEEMLLLAENREETFRKLLEASLNRILSAESAAQLGAGRYEQSEGRTDSRTVSASARSIRGSEESSFRFPDTGISHSGR